MRKAHSQDIPQITQRHKRRQRPRTGIIPKHIPKEQARNDDARLGQVLFRDRRKIGHIRKNIQDRGHASRQRRRQRERPLRILNFPEDLAAASVKKTPLPRVQRRLKHS